MTDLTTDRATEKHCGEPVHGAAGLDGSERLPADGPPSALGVSGVPLTRLIALAGLTPPQVFEIGVALLAEAAKRSEPDDDRLDCDQIMIDTDGGIVLVLESHACGEGTSRPVAGSAAGTVAVVLADLAGAARRRTGVRITGGAAAGRAGPGGGAVSVAGVPSVARTLGEAGGRDRPRAVRAELAALVRAILGRPGSAAGSDPASGPPSRVAGVNGGRRSPSGAAQAAARRIGAWLVSVAVLVAVVLLEVAFLRDEIAADVDLLLDAGRSGSAPIQPRREPDGLPVVPPAPAAAGVVTAVDLRTLGTVHAGFALRRARPGAARSGTRSADRDLVVPRGGPLHWCHGHHAGRIGDRAARGRAGRGCRHGRAAAARRPWRWSP